MVDTSQRSNSARATEPREFPVAAAVTALLCALLLLAHLRWGLQATRFESHVNGVSELLSLELDWRVYVPILSIFVLEWLVPIESTRRHGIRPATVHDAVWTVLHLVMWAPLIVVVLRGGDWLFRHPLSSLRLDLSGVLPNGVLLAIGFLIGEFIRWWVHRTCHRVPFLWKVHSVHHAQTDLRLWTDFRVHPVEAFLREGAVALPFFVLGGRYSSLVGALGFAYVWLTPFHHANVRTNLGPMRWLLVSPQSHRIHHSTDPAHFDTNFGNILCIWDRMFGTQSPDDQSYPRTGVDGYDLDGEQSVDPRTVAVQYVARLADPFRRTA